MSYASFFVGREKRVRCGSLCNERTRLAPTSVATESFRSRGRGWGGGGWGLPVVFGPGQFLDQNLKRMEHFTILLIRSAFCGSF